MKNILKGLTIYLIFCSQAYAQNCESISRFGDLEVCLPESSGLKESYENQYVKSYAESGHHEGNTILGLYLTKGDFNIIGKGGNSQLHEYVKVFASNKSKNISISNSDFENFTASLVGNFKGVNWEALEKKLVSGYAFEEIETPVLVEDYKQGKNCHTYIVVVGFIVEGTKHIQVQISNAVRIKNRLIFMTYYNEYKGAKSIKETKVLNDFLVLKLLNSNS